jgi:hypothetical protein
VSGAGARIRQSKAESADLAPSLVETTFCLKGGVVASPAEKTPSAEVSPRASPRSRPASRELRRPLQPFGVGDEADLDEDSVEIEPGARSIARRRP